MINFDKFPNVAEMYTAAEIGEGPTHINIPFSPQNSQFKPNTIKF